MKDFNLEKYEEDEEVEVVKQYRRKKQRMLSVKSNHGKVKLRRWNDKLRFYNKQRMDA